MEGVTHSKLLLHITQHKSGMCWLLVCLSISLNTSLAGADYWFVCLYHTTQVWQVVPISLSIYSMRLELVYTFCEFLVEFSRVNNQTLQKTCIKPYLFTYVPFNVQKTQGKSWKIAIFSSIFRKLSPTQTAYCKNGPQKYAFKQALNGELLPIITGLAPRAFS